MSKQSLFCIHSVQIIGTNAYQKCTKQGKKVYNVTAVRSAFFVCWHRIAEKRYSEMVTTTTRRRTATLVSC